AKGRRQEAQRAAERRERLAEDLKQRQLQARAIAIAFGKELRELLSVVRAAHSTDVDVPTAVEYLRDRETALLQLLPFATSTPSLLHAAEPTQRLLALVGVLHSLIQGVDPDSLTDSRTESFSKALQMVVTAGEEVQKLIIEMTTQGFNPPHGAAP